MPCYKPLKGYRARFLSANGKRPIVFDKRQGFADRPVEVPCGQCVGCRLERSRQWAIRCVHEAACYEDNCFITLTFDNDHLPSSGSLDVRDFQLFMKRLRKKFGNNIRFYHCGEYGEKNMRPHYHACLFNFDFKDKELFKISRGNQLYISADLQELWPFGYSMIGDVTFESAAYVARYIMKKVNGDQAEDHYTRVDPDTGEVFELKPEYTTMSRRPGIGKPWFDKFGGDVYPDDFVVLRNKKMRPPRYYDFLIGQEDQEKLDRIKRRRKINARQHSENNTPARLKVREKVQNHRLALLPRTLEEE